MKSFDNYDKFMQSVQKNKVDQRENVKIDGQEMKAGRAEINAVLPGEYEVEGKLDDEKVGNLLQGISEDYPEKYTQVANKLRDLGENYTYQKGFSIGIDEISLLEDRKKIVNEMEKELDGVDDEDYQQVGEIGNKYSDKISDNLENQLRNEENNFFSMVDSGSRGSLSQLQQMFATPLMMQDSKGNPVPAAIEDSYGEGLNMPDYFTSMFGARKGIIDKRIAQAKPGEISKELIKTLDEFTISVRDCGTSKHTEKPINDSSLTGRVLAKDVPKVANAGTVVNSNIIQNAEESGIETLPVRSPMTCEAENGICAMCYGHDEFGDFPEEGSNVGVKAGQAMGEPIQQMVMNSFHEGGAVSGEQEAISGLPKINQLLSMPKEVSFEATLAEQPGKVKDIREKEGGGRNIKVETKEGETINHFAPSDRPLTVEEGDEVYRADKLTDGVPDPSNLANLIGVQETRKRLTDELSDAYSGFDINDKIFETASRGVTDLVRIKKSTKDDDFLPGDYASFQTVHGINKEKAEKKEVENAVGDQLADEYNTKFGLYREGDTLMEEDVEKMKKEGIEKVEAGQDLIQFQPEMAGISSIPNYKPDWISQIGFNRIKNALSKGVSQGQKSDIHGYDPLPAYAYGAEFGQSKHPGSY